MILKLLKDLKILIQMSLATRVAVFFIFCNKY